MKAQIPQHTLLLVLFFVIANTVLFAEESFDFSSDSSRIISAQGKKQIIFSGNARISSESIIIDADEIRRYGSDLQYTICTGNVIAKDLEREIEIVCEELFYDTDSDIITIESFSELRDSKNNIVTRSGYLRDNRKDKKTLLSIDVRIYKDDIVCRSEFAWFDHDAQLLELTGRPIVYREGNALKASKISYYLESGELFLDGDVSGQVETEENE